MDLGVYCAPPRAGSCSSAATSRSATRSSGSTIPTPPTRAPPPVNSDAQITRAARRLPRLQVPNTPSGIAGVYDVATDWTPIYDRTASTATTSRWARAATSSRTRRWPASSCATLIDRIESGHDHDADPIRYTGEHTGEVIDLGRLLAQAGDQRRIDLHGFGLAGHWLRSV